MEHERACMSLHLRALGCAFSAPFPCRVRAVRSAATLRRKKQHALTWLSTTRKLCGRIRLQLRLLLPPRPRPRLRCCGGILPMSPSECPAPADMLSSPSLSRFSGWAVGGCADGAPLLSTFSLWVPDTRGRAVRTEPQTQRQVPDMRASALCKGRKRTLLFRKGQKYTARPYPRGRGGDLTRRGLVFFPNDALLASRVACEGLCTAWNPTTPHPAIRGRSNKGQGAELQTRCTGFCRGVRVFSICSINCIADSTDTWLCPLWVRITGAWASIAICLLDIPCPTPRGAGDRGRF